MIILCIVLGLHEELSNPSTYLHASVRYLLDQPTLQEYLLSNLKQMGGIRNEIP